MIKQEQIKNLKQYRKYLFILNQEQENTKLKLIENAKIIVLKKKVNVKLFNVA